MKSSQGNFIQFRPLIIFLLIIWCFQIFNFVTNYSLNGWLGLSTRRSSGLPGILFCPLLHGSFQHAALNTAPLALMGGIIIGIDKSKFLPATFMITVIWGWVNVAFVPPEHTSCRRKWRCFWLPRIFGRIWAQNQKCSRDFRRRICCRGLWLFNRRGCSCWSGRFLGRAPIWPGRRCCSRIHFAEPKLKTGDKDGLAVNILFQAAIFSFLLKN